MTNPVIEYMFRSWEEEDDLVVTFLCVGASHIDEILRLKNSAEKEKSNPVEIESFNAGGVANNIAVNLATMNKKVSMVAPLPMDVILEFYDYLNIDFIELDVNNSKGKYIGILENSGELKYGYAIMDKYKKVTPDMITHSLPDTDSNILVIDANYNQDVIQHTNELAISNSWPCIANGTSVEKVRKLKDLKWTILIVNELEAAELVGKDTVPKMLKKLIKMTKGVVFITCGNKGAWVGNKEIIAHQITPKVAVDNESGAGDTFSAAVCVGFLNKFRWIDTLKIAVCMAASYVANVPEDDKPKLLDHLYDDLFNNPKYKIKEYK